MIAELIGFFAIVIFFLVLGGMVGWQAHGTITKEQLQASFQEGWDACMSRQTSKIASGEIVFKEEKTGKWLGRMLSLAEIAAQVGDKDEDEQVSR